MLLDEPELLVALVAQDFPEQADCVVLLRELFDARDDACSPLDDQVLEPVSLVEVCVHVLLHRLSWQLVLLALLVVLHFLAVDVVDDVSQLLQTQVSDLSGTNLTTHVVALVDLFPHRHRPIGAVVPGTGVASYGLLGCLGSSWSLVGDLSFLFGVFDESVEVLFVLFFQRLDLSKQLTLFFSLFVDIRSVIFL